MKIELNNKELNNVRGGGSGDLTCSCANQYLQAISNGFAVGGTVAGLAAAMLAGDVRARRALVCRIVTIVASALISGGAAFVVGIMPSIKH